MFRRAIIDKSGFMGGKIVDITQTFYDNMASQYDKLFLDWNATTQEQAVILNNQDSINRL